MSVFAPGTGGTLKATTKPSALVEVAHALQMAELRALAANPSNTSQNVTATISFDVGLISLSAAIPFLALLNTSGTISLIPIDYLGAPYSDFAGGGGDLHSTNLVAAFVEMAQLLAAGEQGRPADDRPNQMQVTVDFEVATIVVDASLPFTTATTATGDVVVVAVDYLYEPPPPPPSAAGVAYVASQSSNYNGTIGTYTNLNDDNEATGALTNTGESWIQATFSESVMVSSVTVAGGTIPTAGLIAANNPGLNQSRFQSSADGVSWTDILAISGVADSGANRVKTFPLSTPLTARY